MTCIIAFNYGMAGMSRRKEKKHRMPLCSEPSWSLPLSLGWVGCHLCSVVFQKGIFSGRGQLTAAPQYDLSPTFEAFPSPQLVMSSNYPTDIQNQLFVLQSAVCSFLGARPLTFDWPSGCSLMSLYSAFMHTSTGFPSRRWLESNVERGTLSWYDRFLLLNTDQAVNIRNKGISWGVTVWAVEQVGKMW